MDLPNIKVNQLLNTIADKELVRLIKYENDSIIDEGNCERIASKYSMCDLDVLYIEYVSGGLEITIQTMWDVENL